MLLKLGKKFSSGNFPGFVILSYATNYKSLPVLDMYNYK